MRSTAVEVSLANIRSAGRLTNSESHYDMEAANIRRLSDRIAEDRHLEWMCEDLLLTHGEVRRGNP
jgi:hypothetical protein